MNQVVEWADKESVSILNEVSPYGDLNMNQLVKFYEGFGFVQPDKNVPLMTREMR